MAATSQINETRIGRLGAFAATSTAIVFLLVSAVLLNAVSGAAPLPPKLRNWAVIAHLASVTLALPLATWQLVAPKGTLRHRVVGYIWIGLMVFTALVSFAVHSLNSKGLSPIHLFSAFTLVSAPMIVYAARTGRIAQHRANVLGLLIGGLVVAGLLTFLPGRLLWTLGGRLISAH
jgi:uncharacterized membrane protein